MRNLDCRLRVLEAMQHGQDLSHLTDDELIARLVLVCEQIEEMGGPMPEDWRGAIKRQDYNQLAMSDAWQCAA